MATAPLHYLDLTELATVLRQRELSPVAVTEDLLSRIATLDPRLASYVTVMGENALNEARVAEAEIGAGRYRGPLHGVPVAVKDLCDVSGTRTLAGMPRIRAQVTPATDDATVVARLRAAGAIVLGKLQLTEGAVAHHHPDVKVPINPHHAGYWSGASSSGTGVAVAAGLCYGALGSDTGGSIRFPSYANGVTGLKPTWGRVSRAGVFPLSWSLDHIGPLARSAADCGAILAAIAGADVKDSTAVRAPVPDYLEQLGRDLRGLRIGFDEAYATTRVDPAIVAAMRECVAALQDAGATLVPITFPNSDAAVDAWFPLATAEAAAAHSVHYPAQSSDYGPGLAGLLDTGIATTGMVYARAHATRQEFRGEIARVFDTVDVVVAPALMRQNLTLQDFARFGEKETDWPELLRFTAPFDIAGTPTLSLPAGCNADGAPFGFQLAAGNLREDALLRAGHAWQRVTYYHRMRPDLAPGIAA